MAASNIILYNNKYRLRTSQRCINEGVTLAGEDYIIHFLECKYSIQSGHLYISTWRNVDILINKVVLIFKYFNITLWCNV